MSTIQPHIIHIFRTTQNFLPFNHKYEPGTITGVHCSIDSYLRETEYEVNILHSPLFKSSHEMVEAKRRFLKSCGKGNDPNKAVALTEEEVKKFDCLWD